MTGYGTFSLAVPDIPAFGSPDVAEFAWAIGIGLAAAVLGTGIKRMGLLLQPIVERRMVVLTPLVGLAIGGLAVDLRRGDRQGFVGGAVLRAVRVAVAHPERRQLDGWRAHPAHRLQGSGLRLLVERFRGGPTFPGMYIGAAGGIALSHLAGLPLIAGVAMGIGAMTVAMLGLPLTSVLLATLFLQADGLALMPLVIVAVVVAYVASVRLAPASTAAPAAPHRHPHRPRSSAALHVRGRRARIIPIRGTPG